MKLDFIIKKMCNYIAIIATHLSRAYVYTKNTKTPLKNENSTQKTATLTTHKDSEDEKVDKIDWKRWYVGTGWKEYHEDGKKEACKMAKRKCIEAGFPDWLTHELLSTLQGESGFNIFCRNSNKDKKGNEWSFDAGIAQLSSAYYLKYYNMSEQDAYDNPEKCVDIIISAFKSGRADDWIAHKHWKNHQNYPCSTGYKT